MVVYHILVRILYRSTGTTRSSSGMSSGCYIIVKDRGRVLRGLNG